jgi:hypothetical protein
LNLELRRLAVDMAITQTDVARLKLTEPEKPAAEAKTPTTTASPTVARDLVDALQFLNDTQQQFIFTWTDYEIMRRLLDFELGTMQLDDRGIWVDPGPLTDEGLMVYYYAVAPTMLYPNENDETPELGPTELPPEPALIESPEGAK